MRKVAYPEVKSFFEFWFRIVGNFSFCLAVESEVYGHIVRNHPIFQVHRRLNEELYDVKGVL